MPDQQAIAPKNGDLSTVSARIAQACAALVALAVLTVIPYRIAEAGYLNHVSGSWGALADDFAHGVLYRPLLSDLGYGGTRNFPLQFVLQGTLAALGLPLRAAGYLISLASALTIVAGGATAFRRRGASRWVAWSLGLVAIASRTAFMGAAGIRGDLLPVALGVLGLVLVPSTDDEAPVAASIFLGLSVIAKPTLFWAPGGAFIALVVARRWRSVVLLSLMVAAVTVTGLVGSQLASHGSMLASFRACASGGGFSISTLLGAMSYFRPGDLAWAFGGLGLTLARGRKGLSDPLGAAGFVCLPVTLFIFTSRGAHVNHLVDITTIGALAVGAALVEASVGKITNYVLVVATLLGTSEAVLLGNVYTKYGELERAAAALPAGSDPVLSEQPWIPLLAGERAFALDAYNLLQLRHSMPAVDRDFLGRMDHCGFRAVVLMGKPDQAPEWYDQVQFGSGFRERLQANYVFEGIVGAHAFYLPHCASSPTPKLQLPPDAGSAETVLDRMRAPGLLHALAGVLHHGH